MNIYIGADHRGFDIKQSLIPFLQGKGHSVIDCGDTAPNPDDDYVDFAKIVAQKVAEDPESRGIVLCGSGVGVDITANKVKGIRCGLAFNPEQIASATSHDHLNIIALPADYIHRDQAEKLVDIFLVTPYHKESRYTNRLDKIGQLEAL